MPENQTPQEKAPRFDGLSESLVRWFFYSMFYWVILLPAVLSVGHIWAFLSAALVLAQISSHLHLITYKK